MQLRSHIEMMLLIYWIPCIFNTKMLELKEHKVYLVHIVRQAIKLAYYLCVK